MLLLAQWLGLGAPRADKPERTSTNVAAIASALHLQHEVKSPSGRVGGGYKKTSASVFAFWFPLRHDPHNC